MNFSRNDIYGDTGLPIECVLDWHQETLRKYIDRNADVM
jgi:hypothetical protein